ncbi:hypothetical protein [Agromyces archimandritae]|uniref:Uncharacterized protein n=1 Tax=Agromyces archimandritae TaxID=2781962 RepID=A0A975INV7_9MICO|nr:hypothetical protein [Agromyces archimandritae]QTX03321.1 hypothetical protein G127AT_07955 [Agromyces archimandritae]
MTGSTERSPRRRGRTGRVRTVVAAGTLLLGGIAATAASFTDQAVVDLGSGAIGNPGLFDVDVLEDGEFVDAVVPEDAVPMMKTSGSAPAFTTTGTPVEYQAFFVNSGEIDGTLTFRVYDPDDTGDGDLFHKLVFTIVLLQSGRESEITGASAEEVNAANIAFDRASKQTVTVTIRARLADDADVAGLSTQVGVRVEGESL